MSIPQLSNSSKYVLELLWDNGPLSAKDIASYLYEERGYAKGTTYKLIQRLIEKGFVEKREPDFICIPLYSHDQVLGNEIRNFLDRFFHGSFSNLTAQFVDNRQISKTELEVIQQIIDSSIKKKEEGK